MKSKIKLNRPILFSRNKNISGNIIKPYLRTSMNERTHYFIKNISLTLYSRKGWSFCRVWEMGRETYTQREDFFFSYDLPKASGCQQLHPLASSSETPLIGCVSFARLRFSALCLNLTTWFSSRGLLLVVPECPDRAVIFLFTNENVTACQSTCSH